MIRSSLPEVPVSMPMQSLESLWKHFPWQASPILYLLSMSWIRQLLEKRPDITVIARARDRVTVFQLYDAGADHIVREAFDSSLRAGRYVLEEAGLSPYEASELERIYYQMDRAHLRQLAQCHLHPLSLRP